MKPFFLLSAALLMASSVGAVTNQESAKPVTKAATSKPKTTTAKPQRPAATKFAPATGVKPAAGVKPVTTVKPVAGVGRGVSARDLRIRQQQTAKKPASSAQSSTRKSAMRAMDLIIPEIGINAPIVFGIDNETLKRGVGVDPLSSIPGQRGNSVIAGHRNVWGAWFWDLPRLKPGSPVYVKTPDATYTFRVAFTRVAQPTDTSLLEHPSDPKITRLTLYTCTKPKTECRFVVVANLVKKDTAPVAIPSGTLAATKTNSATTTVAQSAQR